MTAPTTASRRSGVGHGKVILIGEHAVVYGHPALAAGLSVGITVRARPGGGRLRVPAWGLDATANDDSAVGRALAAIVRRLGAPALDFDADADVPSRAGLGSSAALAVAVARAAAAACARPPADGAVDAAGRRGGDALPRQPVGHRRGRGQERRRRALHARDRMAPGPRHQAITLCVGLSGRPRDTAAQVAAVARLRERLSVADDIMARWASWPTTRPARWARATSTGWGGCSTPRTACWRAAGLRPRARRAGPRGARGGRDRRQADRRGRRRRGDRARARPRARRARALEAAGFDGFRAGSRRRSAVDRWEGPTLPHALRGGGQRSRDAIAMTRRTPSRVAGTNIALVKYWGKRDMALNLPATGSLSLTLDRLGTRTTVAFDDGAQDRLVLDGAPAGDAATARVSAFLDRVRARAELARRALVTSDNSVPTAVRAWRRRRPASRRWRWRRRARPG